MESNRISLWLGRSKGNASIASYDKKNIGGTELQEDAEGSMEIVALDSFYRN
jgi:hypothetical protein